MTNDPLAGRLIRAPERSRMLLATEDGVFLWPGIALVERRGNGYFALEPREINSRIGAFFGPAAIHTPLLSVLEMARDQLRQGQQARVQRRLDRLLLPPVSPNGERLMRTIAERHGLAVPDVPVTSEQSGSLWSDRDIEIVARVLGDLWPRTRALEKIFNPGTAWDPAKHPRWPSGESDGGQFRPNDGSGGSSTSPIRPVSIVGQTVGRDLLGDPPKIPQQAPPTGHAKNEIRKEVAHWLVQAALVGADITAPEIVIPVQVAVEGAFWLAPYVNAYLDKPKSLEELQASVNTQRGGTDVHHIVEQKSARNDKFPESQIQDPSNLVRISTLKHWELNAWYDAPNDDYGGQTPRQYVKGKNWDTRRQVGLAGLKAVGVLEK